jgi:hypothetical protein
MKKILIGVVIVAVLVIGGIFFTVSNLDGLVKTAIEKIGTKVAGVDVKVSKVTLSLKEGKASIEGLTVANPKGFSTPTAIGLGAVSVSIDPSTVTGSPIVIKDVSIVAPQVTYELSTQGSNIDAIKKNVDAFVSASGGEKETASKEAPAKESKADDHGAKLVIAHLSVTQGKVTLATPIPGGAATAKLGDITLKDIGKSSGGTSPGDVAAKLLDALSKSAITSASQLSLSSVTDALKDKGNAGAALDQVKGLLGK